MVPGTTEVTPSLLVTPTSFRGVSVSVSLAVLLAALVSLAAATVTVLVSTPVAEGSMVANTV